MDNKKKLIRKYQQTIEGTKEEIFPLLCPVREKEWLQGWDYKMIYSESSFAEKGCIFETSNNYGSYHWIVTKHDKDIYEIQFIKIKTNDIYVIIDIELTEKSEKVTFCNIQYTFIPLGNEAAEIMFRENTEDVFNQHMKIWEDSLNYYLKHDKMLLIE
jgi:ribosome modulation factor